MSNLLRRLAGGPGARRLTCACLLWAAVAALVPARAGATTSLVVAPVAGTGAAGAPVAGPAVGSPLSAPSGVAVDVGGDVIIADPASNEVLRVTPGGTLSVLAGTGIAGAAVAGPAVGSPLSAPRGVAVDAAGDVYIADTGNAVVEKVTPDGVLSVLAGSGVVGAAVAGPAVGSPLRTPEAVAVDGAGDVFIADAAAAVVEKVTAAGVLTVLAGSGVVGAAVAGPAVGSPLRTPVGVAVDATGNVFIADAAANVVEKVTAAGRLSVFAGRASGAAGAPSAGRATWSRLWQPGGVALDAAGNLYIADTANNRIEEVTPGGRLSLLGGTGAAGRPTYGAAALSSALRGPQGVAVQADGIVDLADGADATVVALQPPPPGVVSGPGLSSGGREGQTVTASAGLWSGTVTAYGYRWEDCDAGGGSCAVVPGATSASYVLGARDVGHTVRALVGASGPFGGGSAASAASGVVVPLAPAIVSAPIVLGVSTDRQTLSVSPGAWRGSPTSYAYQWRRCNAGGGGCGDIDGATAATYTLVPGDVGGTVRVTVTAVNAGGRGSGVAAPSAVIAPATSPWANVDAPALVSAPTIGDSGGSQVVGDRLVCSPGRWSGAPSDFSFAWRRDHVAIPGATASSYTVVADDRGHQLGCSVLASNQGGAIRADSVGVAVPGLRSGVPATPRGAGGAWAAGAARRHHRLRRHHRTRHHHRGRHHRRGHHR